MTKISGARIVCLAAGLVIASACSSSSGSGGSSQQAKVVKRADAEKEYQQAMGRLVLPAGSVAFPSNLPETQGRSLYETGYATSLAERFWICSWEKEWLHQRSIDAPRATAAFTQVEKAPDTEFMRQHLDDVGRRFFAEYLTKARLGDPSGIQEDVSANCSG